MVRIFLKCITTDARVFHIRPRTDIPVKVLRSALSSYLAQLDAPLSQNQGASILSVRLGSTLKDTQRLCDLPLEDGDELLVYEVRCCEENTKTDDFDPGQNAVLAATMERTPVYHDSSTAYISSPSSTAVIVTLIEVAQQILSLDKRAVNMFVQMCSELPKATGLSKGECSKENALNLGFAAPDPTLVSQLVEMGFSMKQAQQALRLTRNMITEATEWLVASHSAAAAEERTDDVSSTTSSNMSLHSTEQGDTGDGDSIEISLPEGDFDLNAYTPAQLLRIYQVWSYYRLQPNLEAKQYLMELGFSEAAVNYALRESGNDRSEALDMLLAKKISQWSLQKDFARIKANSLVGLPRDSEHRRVLLEDPEIQLGLANPKSLVALLSFLDQSNSTIRWLLDPDIQAFIQRIDKLGDEDTRLLNRSITSLQPRFEAEDNLRMFTERVVQEHDLSSSP